MAPWARLPQRAGVPCFQDSSANGFYGNNEEIHVTHGFRVFTDNEGVLAVNFLCVADSPDLRNVRATSRKIFYFLPL